MIEKIAYLNFIIFILTNQQYNIALYIEYITFSLFILRFVFSNASMSKREKFVIENLQFLCLEIIFRDYKIKMINVILLITIQSIFYTLSFFSVSVYNEEKFADQTK